MVQKLLKLNLPHSIISFVYNFLTDRLKYVKLSPEVKSKSIVTNTGAPQDTVLAPFLFTLSTSDCLLNHHSCPLIKFADDTALIGLIVKDDDTYYRDEIDNLVKYCKRNHMILNCSKTKEMLVDYRKVKPTIAKVMIDNYAVERVDFYKYLGVMFDCKLSWSNHVDYIVKKLSPRLYCLRKLKSFNNV